MKFRVEQYEIHAQSYTVEANSQVEALEKVLSGEATPEVGKNSLKYVETAEDIGMPLDNVQATDSEFERFCDNVGIVDDFVPTIRSIEEIKE